MSYGEKRRSAASCREPGCDAVGTSLALDHYGKPQWFCPDHLKKRKP